MPPHLVPPPGPRRARRGVRLGLGACLVLALAAPACSGDGEDDPGGFGTAREVVDAHVTRSAAYDLVGDCELRHPDVIAEMASFDGREPDGYCAWAVQGLLADATPEQRADTRAKYTGATVTAGPVDDDEAAFTLEAADGSYHEDIVVERIDGRWFLRSAEGIDEEQGHDHEH